MSQDVARRGDSVVRFQMLSSSTRRPGRTLQLPMRMSSCTQPAHSLPLTLNLPAW